jgi:hypothetical protein
MPIVGQTELSRRPVKESNPKTVFQLRHLTGDSGYAEFALAGDGRKRARLHHPHQDSQRTEKVHRFTLMTQKSVN